MAVDVMVKPDDPPPDAERFYYYMPAEKKAAAREALRNHTRLGDYRTDDSSADILLEHIWNILSDNYD